MTSEQVNKRHVGPYGCPVEASLDVIGGKWKGVILYYLLKEKKRFGELRKLIPNISQQSLTLQLRELENDEVIERTVYAEVPPRVEYAFTDFGRTLEPVIILLLEWGERYNERISEAKGR